MRPDAATPTAPEVVDHGVLAAVLKQGAFDPADGTLALRHGEEEQHLSDRKLAPDSVQP